MSTTICTCDSPVKHLGLPNCSDQIGILLRAILVPLYQNDGTMNYIDTTDTLDAAYLNGLQYNTSADQRYFPIPIHLEEVVTEKGETVYQTYASGRKQKVRDGVRPFKAIMPGVPAVYVDKINSKGCAKHGVFFVDSNGALVGQEKSAGLLYPFAISDNTLNAHYSFATDSTVPNVMLEFEFDPTVLDGQISFINASDMTLNMLEQFNGKQDAYMVQVAGNRSATTFSFDLYTSYGSAKTKIPIEGLVTADFTLYNVTDSTSETFTSVTESTTVPGRYAAVISTSETTTDDLRLGLSSTDAAKPFDAETWEDTLIQLD